MRQGFDRYISKFLPEKFGEQRSYTGQPDTVVRALPWKVQMRLHHLLMAALRPHVEHFVQAYRNALSQFEANSEHRIQYPEVRGVPAKHIFPNRI